MGAILLIHRTYGEMILPLLIVAAAVWFSVTWKPNSGRTTAARVFVYLVVLQFVLGLTWWIYGIAVLGNTTYIGWPFILHPLLGLIAVGLASYAAHPRGALVARLGRWSPLVSMAGLLLVVLAGIVVATSI